MPAVLRALGITMVAALALAVPAAADPPSYGIVHVRVPPGTPPLQLGRQLYAANCATCHGSLGEGTQGPPLVGAGALAADFYLRTGYMPLARPDVQPARSRVLFSEREIDALVAYVATLGVGPEIPKPQPERGNLSRGLRLFTSHCAGCH